MKSNQLSKITKSGKEMHSREVNSHQMQDRTREVQQGQCPAWSQHLAASADLALIVSNRNTNIADIQKAKW